ncbi:MAG: hypothetical protein E7387_05405 [Ruminococcaceae bacterium]|nr:hypothetical protein [Oscillospiraceae bacterium]
MLSIDPTAMLEQQKKQKSEEKQKRIPQVFIFSLLGALVGGMLCVLLDFVLIGSVTGLFYLLVGMSAYAFYLYFIQRKHQKKIHLLVIAMACLLATMLSVFLECMILYAPDVKDASMNIFQKTMELYKHNISRNGFSSQAHQTIGGDVLYYSLSLISTHIVCAIMAEIGFFASFGILTPITKKWEKKHGQENTEYGYSTRKNRK